MTEKKDKLGPKCLKILLKIGKTVLNLLFSHGGLALLVAAYCAGGAYMFQYFELGHEMRIKEVTVNISIEIESMKAEMFQLLSSRRLVDNETVAKWINDYDKLVKRGIGLGYSGELLDASQMDYGWSLASALLFTVTIVTTIGYGHIAPKTRIGQIMVIPYSLLGVPLMLMFLADIGEAAANLFRSSYAKGCCRLCWTKRHESYESHRKLFREYEAMRDRPGIAWNDSTSDDVDIESTKETPKKDTTEFNTDDVTTIQELPNSTASDSNPGQNPTEEVPDLERRWSLESIGDHMITSDEINEEVMNIPVSLTVMMIFVYILLGTILFAAWNDWTWVESAYFSFVTLSTIGFGDYVPGYNELGTTWGTFKLGISAIYIVFGMAVLSMSFNLMMEEIVAKFKWLGRTLGIVKDRNAVPETIVFPVDPEN